jgi:hypothetical protein
MKAHLSLRDKGPNITNYRNDYLYATGSEVAAARPAARCRRSFITSNLTTGGGFGIEL